MEHQDASIVKYIIPKKLSFLSFPDFQYSKNYLVIKFSYSY